MSWLESESCRVVRGGSWFLAPQGARVASRVNDAPGLLILFLGLRLVRRCT
mgnify:CR=1 FL=1